MSARTKAAAFVAGALLALAQAGVAENAPDNPAAKTFRFKNTAGQPIAYAVSLRIKGDLDFRVGEEFEKTKIDLTRRCNLKLTPKVESQTGVTTCVVSTSESDIVGSIDDQRRPGKVHMEFRGKHTRITRMGVVLVDTENGIGTAMASEFNKEMGPLYSSDPMSAELDLDSRGHIKDVRGEPRFAEFWKSNKEAGLGFLGIVFPEAPVAVGESWWENVAAMKTGLQVKLANGEMRWTFRREPDISAQGKRVAVFNLSTVDDKGKRVAWVPEPGQKAQPEIPAMRGKVRGTFHFDPQRGVLADGQIKFAMVFSASETVEGEEASGHGEIEAEIGLKLLPEGASRSAQ